jgi:hypothetical protein
MKSQTKTYPFSSLDLGLQSDKIALQKKHKRTEENDSGVELKKTLNNTTCKEVICCADETQ